MHQYKVSEWESASGHWYVADTSDLANDSAAWWMPARLLNLTLEDYIDLLVNTYHATIDGFYPESNKGKSLLVFHWEQYNDAHKYLLWINRMARNGNWTI